MTGISKKEEIFLIGVDDGVLKLIKRGEEYFQVHNHNYDVDFFSYRNLSITMKKLQFLNQKFELQFYANNQMSINILKQIIFEKVHQLYNTNVGLELETADGFLYDTRIVATLRKNEIINVNTFEIKLVNYTLEFDRGEAEIECINNLTNVELEQLTRQTFVLGKNIKLFSNMKKSNMNLYFKNFEKFQIVFKNAEKQFSLCEMIERKYEILVRDKSFNLIGIFFNEWNIDGLIDYIGLYIGNRRNEFIVTFINSKLDACKNITLYGTTDKIYATYVANTERRNQNIS
jgi:hypothetical protein